MFGRMLKNMRHAAVIYGVMMALFVIVMIGWAIYWDTLTPNPALWRMQPLADGQTQQPYRSSATRTASSDKKPVIIPALAGLPVDQEPGQPRRARSCASARPPARPSPPSRRR